MVNEKDLLAEEEERLRKLEEFAQNQENFLEKERQMYEDHKTNLKIFRNWFSGKILHLPNKFFVSFLMTLRRNTRGVH